MADFQTSAELLLVPEPFTETGDHQASAASLLVVEPFVETGDHQASGLLVLVAEPLPEEAPPAGLQVTYWDGAQELPATVTWWDGSAESAIAAVEHHAG